MHLVIFKIKNFVLGKRFFSGLLLLLPCCIFSQNPDISLLRSINSPETLAMDGFFRFVSNSEACGTIGIPAGMAIAGLIKHDNKLIRNASISLTASAVNYCISNAVKLAVNRDRPYLKYPDIIKKVGGGGPSFPSGHTSAAFTVATSLSLAYPKWYIIAPSYLWAGTVAYSRMHLGMHYPSDVLAGALIGAGSAYLSYKINQQISTGRRIRP